MISERVEYAFDDMNERIWTEAGLKAEELLPTDEAQTIRHFLNSADHDAKALKTATQHLDDATQTQESLVRRGLV